jgi:dolichol-phosphate mannosyltransferase
MSSPGKFLSVVVPTFQEALNIESFLDALCDSLDVALEGRYEVIVVDDASPDGTHGIVAEIARRRPQVRAMRRASKQGAATAVASGWQAAQGEFLATINADFQHPPGLLAQMLELASCSDLVVASRYREGGGVGDWPLLRRLLSKSAQALGAALAPAVFGRVTDPLSGCFVLRREAVAGVALRPIGYKTLLEVLGRGRIERIAEIPYVMHARSRGASKVALRHWLDYGVQLWRLRRSD